jgi:hypothetical protein
MMHTKDDKKNNQTPVKGISFLSVEITDFDLETAYPVKKAVPGQGDRMSL